MAKERGPLLQVWRAFVASLKPRMSKVRFVGEDFHGTKYYEDPEARHQRGRSFVPQSQLNFEQEIPAEWESWLRYRRREPPTEEEVKANYRMIQTKRKNAAELEEQYTAEKIEKYKKEGKPLEPPPKDTLKFPVYEEYKDYGEDYRTKMPR